MPLLKEQGFWAMTSQLAGTTNGETAREIEISMERSSCDSHKMSFVNSALDMSRMANLSTGAPAQKRATIASLVAFRANTEVMSNIISWP